MCVDAGGGYPRGRKFLRSMSDFKPGEDFSYPDLPYLCGLLGERLFRAILPMNRKYFFPDFLDGDHDTPGTV